MRDLQINLCEIFLNASPDLMVYLNIDGTILDCNTAFCEFIGLRKEEILHKKYYEMITRLDAHQDECLLSRSTKLTKREEMEMVVRGKTFKVTVDPIVDNLGSVIGFVHIATDITNYKMLINKMQESEERFKEIFNSSSDGQIIMKGKFLEVNNRITEIFRCRKEDIVGKHPADFSPQFQPDGSSSLEKSNSLINMAISGVDQYFYWQHTDLNGRTIDTNINLKKIKLNGEDFLLATVRDISEEIFYNKVRKALNDRLHLLERAENLQQITLGLVHDLNNTMMAIMGYLDLLSHQTEGKTLVFIQMREALEKAKRFIDMLFKVSTGSKREMVAHNLNSVIMTTLDWLKPLKKENINTKIDLAKDPLMIMGHELSTQQIVMNLIINSIEAIGNRQGSIIIKTGTREYDEHQIRQNKVNTQLKKGRYTFMEIKDDGCGMSKETLEKIFEPFFTTKFYGKGLGMLSVKNAIESCNGGLFVESVEQKGTRFEILFPLLTDSSTSEQGREKGEDICIPEDKGKNFVLIADRDEIVRGIATRLVSSIKMGTIEASTPEDIRKALEDYSGRISVALIDVSSMDIDTLDTVDLIRKTAGDILIVVSGSYIDRDLIGRLLGRQGIRFLAKPYTVDDLEKVLKEGS